MAPRSKAPAPKKEAAAKAAQPSTGGTDPVPARDDLSGQVTTLDKTIRSEDTVNPDPKNPAAMTNRPDPGPGPSLHHPGQKLLPPDQNPPHAPNVIVNVPYGSEPRTLDTDTGIRQPPTPGAEMIAAGAVDGKRITAQDPNTRDTLTGAEHPDRLQADDTADDGEDEDEDTVQGGQGDDTAGGGQSGD